MSLYKNGEIWYYDFVVKGKRYCGSTGLLIRGIPAVFAGCR